MQTFTEKALALAPWSYSKARMALECPFKFGLKYVKKTKEPPQARSKELEIGKALHKALEYVMNGMPASAAIDETLNIVILTADEQDEYFASYDKIVEFSARIKRFKAQHGISRNRQFVEQRVAIAADFTPAAYWNDDKRTVFRGQWDLGMYSKSGYMVVVDHKRRGAADIDKYEKQLKSYAVTALALHPTIAGVKGAVHFIERGEILWAPTYSAEQIREEIQPEFVEWINKAADEHTSDTIHVGYYCKWCPFKDSICLPERSARRKQARVDKVKPNVLSR